MNAAPAIDRAFTTTHWSVVLKASRHESQVSDEALERLCRDYWQPVYMFLRRSGCVPHDAEDLTQAFFERILQKNYLRAVDRSKGKFRCFLLAMLRHFLANHRRDARAQKRGGGVEIIHLDDELDEAGPCPADVQAARSFDRQWAMTVLDQVSARLAEEFQNAGKGRLFDALRIFLTGEKAAANYGEVAGRLHLTEAAVKMAVSRLRRRYGELLRAEIARTVSTAEEVDEELRALMAALS